MGDNWDELLQETYRNYQFILEKLQKDLDENEDWYAKSNGENYYNYDRYLKRKFDLLTSISNIKQLQKYSDQADR